jgi:ABC-type nitrate/sulfonate/bicarbonate transport system permease component
MKSLAPAASSVVPESASIAQPAQAPVTRASKPGRLRRRLADYALSVTGPLVFVLIWWLAVASNVLPPSVLPSPVTVGAAMVEWAVGPTDAGPYSGTMLESIAASGGRVAVGFAIAAALGILIGIPTGFFPLMGRILDPLTNLLRPIPVTAWVPLSLVFWGFGFRGAVFLIALGSFSR